MTNRTSHWFFLSILTGRDHLSITVHWEYEITYTMKKDSNWLDVSPIESMNNQFSGTNVEIRRIKNNNTPIIFRTSPNSEYPFTTGGTFY